jgi:hypothetical protein
MPTPNRDDIPSDDILSDDISSDDILSDVDASEKLTKRETLPVTDVNGKVLGTCTIRKFVRQAGRASNHIIIHDSGPVAEIYGFRLHSRVCCGDHEGNSKRIDSKDAVLVARAALENAGNSKDVLGAIQEVAEILAEERSLKRRRQKDRGDS